MIGRNFTELPQIAYYKVGDRLKFLFKNEFCFQEYLEVETRKSTLDKPIVSDTVSIPPGTVNSVQVKVNNEEVILPIQNMSKNKTVLNAGDQLNNIVLSVEGSSHLLEPR